MPANHITHAEVRMYRLGTGDCFALKFFASEQEAFKMLIDAGAWQVDRHKLEPAVADLMNYVNKHVQVLVVTHEHKDHVSVFEACKDLFTGDFVADEIWMAWTENDQSRKVKEWKKEYGNKKKALALAAQKIQTIMKGEALKKQFSGAANSATMLRARQVFSDVLTGFVDLHLSVDGGEYAGGLKGMDIVKTTIAKNNIRYFKPGDIADGVGDIEGMKFYVLGPPRLKREVEKESGGEGETYDHNKELAENSAFAAAMIHFDQPHVPQNLLPFDERFEAKNAATAEAGYNETGKEWRRIDFDWLYGAGSLALRMNSLTNNLSLALAIEFGQSGRVMLFPGDAEYGSWASWHRINWNQKGRDKKKHLTEDLLNRTVFYKVAHHLSHNGTARRLGLEMMTHKDLAAMATLDYSNISNGWKSTMPNRAIIKELLNRTKGRLMIMNETDLYYDFNKEEPLSHKIRQARERMGQQENTRFLKNFKETDLYLQYTVEG